MKIISTYSVRLGKGLSVTLNPTLVKYREAVAYFVDVIDNEWPSYSGCKNANDSVRITEHLTIETAKNPIPKYNFSVQFYKFPSYLRRSAIAEAFGIVSSYRSNMDNWLKSDAKTRGRRPAKPTVGDSYPAMYRDNCFVRTGTYTARIKVYVRNTWDWVDVTLRKTDVDYILKHCSLSKECVPTLRKRGKNWSLDFAFEKQVPLNQAPVKSRRILSVDLGLNSAATCCVMESDGTVLARRFLSLEREYDCLYHMLARIKHAQQSGARRMPNLWVKANGINRNISEKTAQFIEETSVLYECDVVVMENLNLKGKKRGSKRQRLHHWRAKYVEVLVEHKCHMDGNRFATVTPYKTSRLAFDGSGEVKRGKESEKTNGNYSLCEFQNGKVYNCDLNASYNIGARYFIREILGSISERRRCEVEAKVPSLQKRSTCTLSDLKALHLILGGSNGGNLGDSCAAHVGQAPHDAEAISHLVELVTYGKTRDSDAPQGQPPTAAIGSTRLKSREASHGKAWLFDGNWT